MKKAFTLAEVMITLTVIGVITAVIVPVAMSTRPDDNVLKFKKGHNTLYQVISTLIKSDDYYKDGDLGVRADGTVMSGKNDTEIMYFCNTFADIVSAKKVNCSNKGYYFNEIGYGFAWQDDSIDGSRADIGCSWVTKTLAQQKASLDKVCTDSKVLEVGEEIVLPDGIVYYQSSPKQTFGIYFLHYANGAGIQKATPIYDKKDAAKIMRHFGEVVDTNGFTCTYKIICMDVDGIKKGEAPFAYGITAQGKIVTGARADEWLQKSNQVEK